MRHLFLAFLAFLAVLLLPTLASAAMRPGMNCTVVSNACQTTASQVPVAQALHMQSVRVRIVRPHLIYQGTTYGQGTAHYVMQNFDPIAYAAGSPDTTCGFTDYPIHVNNAAQFTTGAVVADFLDPSLSPQICAVAAPIIYLTQPPTYYLNTNTFTSGIGGGGTIALLQAGGIGVHLNFFNPDYRGDNSADGPLVDQTGSTASCTIGVQTMCDTMYKTAIQFTLNLVALTGTTAVPQAYLLTQGNEEDGGVSAQCGSGAGSPNPTSLLQQGTTALNALQTNCISMPPVGFTAQTLTMNGDWGDLGVSTTPNLAMTHQIQKLRDLCTVAHSLSPPALCSDGGIETSGIEAAYLDELWNKCTVTTLCFCPTQLACRQAADIFQQWGFNKSAKQAFNQQNLQTSCQTFTPPYLPTHAGIIASRAESIILEEANAGSPQDVDQWNFHWYDVAGQGFAPAINFFSKLTGKPPMADEVSIYTNSWPDMVRLMGYASVSMQLVDIEWWNQGGGGGDASLSGGYACTSGCSPSQVTVLPNTGAVWNAYFTGQPIQSVLGFAPPQPFC